MEITIARMGSDTILSRTNLEIIGLTQEEAISNMTKAKEEICPASAL